MTAFGHYRASPARRDRRVSGARHDRLFAPAPPDATVSRRCPRTGPSPSATRQDMPGSHGPGHATWPCRGRPAPARRRRGHQLFAARPCVAFHAVAQRAWRPKCAPGTARSRHSRPASAAPSSSQGIVSRSPAAPASPRRGPVRCRAAGCGTAHRTARCSIPARCRWRLHSP